jgi:hypothetical protein
MMNFFEAINAHVAWKLRLRKHIDGVSEEVLDPEVVGCDDKCALGQWIYRTVDAYDSMPLFHQVRVQHADFHRCAAEIIVAADEGKKDKAEQLLHDDYGQLSHMIVKSLTKLSKELGDDVA